ncbi:acyl-CoA synthetase [Legionella steigerwaltii]|uniref:Acyl-CoA synthetase n=1 Tax=Legionella steigerwaltii TaxID=460 RepID=A0A378L7L4_9GAMM|nr:alpha/beta fold hydrolase [Legionella steigerwaltii]KTD77506.1 acyl-CoA synthetase [Legionella steigerwaltii]STY22816.1 acyl-CoA synthetase [Legionella steigerwaltii]
MSLSESELSQLKLLTEALDLHAQRTPDSIALYYLNEDGVREQLSYSKLQSEARSLARLIMSKTQKGDRVLLIYPPGLEFVIAFFACMYAGVISVPSYPPFNQGLIEKLQGIIVDAQPSILLTSQELYKKLYNLQILKKVMQFLPIKKLLIYILGRQSEQLNWEVEKLKLISCSSNHMNSFSRLESNSIDPNSIVFLQYTSGSTGLPKGVINTHLNLLHNIQLIIKAYRIHQDSRGVSWLPPYHDMGLIGHIILPVIYGVPCILMSPLKFLKNPYSWLQEINSSRADVSGGPNFAYEYCLRKITEPQKKALDLSCWRVAVNGAEPIHYETLERFYQAFKSCGFKKNSFSPSYGLAESTVMVSVQQPQGHLHKLIVSQSDLSLNQVTLTKKSDTDSKILLSHGNPSLDVKILNLSTKQFNNENEVGEILVAGSSVSPGYWQNEESNKALFHHADLNGSGQRAFLKTGDLGFLHQGELYVTGRIKQLIVIHGKNFYPHDIEYKACAAHASIKPGCCTAFSIFKDYEEKLVILAELKLETDKKEYHNICLAVRKSIAQIFSITPYSIVLLPARATLKTTSGKLQRNAMKESYVNQSLPILYEYKKEKSDFERLKSKLSSNLSSTDSKAFNGLTEKELRSWLLEHIALKTSIPQHKLLLDKSLIELGIDSMGYFELLAELEQTFNCRADLSLIETYPSINSICKSIMNNKVSTEGQIFNFNPYHDELGPHGFLLKRKEVGVLLVHGYSGTPGEVSELAFQLAKSDITVAVPQLAGHCSSYSDLKNTNWQDWYTSVKKAFDLLSQHCEKIFVAGLSAGSLLALNLALENPEHIAGVILLSPVFFYDGWNISKWQRAFNSLMIHSYLRYIYKVRDKAPYGIKNETIREAIASLLVNGKEKNIAKTGNMIVPALGLYEVDKLIKYIQGKLSCIKSPTLVVHSLDDDMASYKNAEYVKNHIGSELIEIVYLNNSYHIITLDNEKELVALNLIRFIKQNSKSRKARYVS